MKIFNALLIFAVSWSASAFAVQKSVTGNVKLIRHHQYLTDTGWDKHVWFCIDTSEHVGSCATTPTCGNNIRIVIDKNAQKEIFSTVLAARVSQIPITVQLDDSHKFGESCYARLIDM